MTEKPSKSSDSVMQSKATSLVLRKLIWAGVIPSRSFIRALNVTAECSFLKRYGLLFLFLMGLAYIIAGMCALFAIAWQDFPFILKMLILSSSLIISSFLASNDKKPFIKVFFTCCSVLLTGGLLLISCDNLTMGKPLWTIAVIWAVITLPWVLLARSLVVLHIWFGIVLTAYCLWGIEIGMPTEIITWSTFFNIMAAFMGCILCLREALVYFKYCPFIKHTTSRLNPLLLCLTLSLFPILGCLFGLKNASLSDSIIIFMLMSILAMVVYMKIFPDYAAVTIIIFEFCCMLSVFCINRHIYSHDNWYFVFLAIIAMFSFSSFLLRKIKHKLSKRE